MLQLVLNRMNLVKHDAALNSSPKSRWRYNFVVGALLVLCVVLAVTSLRKDSVTFDETSHLTAGLSYWVTGDYRLTPDHPPLAQLWAAIPLLLTDHGWSVDLPGWRESNFWLVGRSWFAGTPDIHRLLCYARSMIVLLLLATCWLTFTIARSLWGRTGGLLALTLAVLSPTLLAHGRLVTTDLPATLLFLLVIYSYARLVDKLTIARFAWAALSLAALSLTKFSWPLVLPALLIMASLAVLRKPKTTSGENDSGKSVNLMSLHWLSTRARRGAVTLGIAILSGVVVWLAIWSAFSWRYSPYKSNAEAEFQTDGQPLAVSHRMTDDKAWRDVLSDDGGQPLRSAASIIVRWARNIHLLPEAYLFGLAYTDKTTQQRDAYFLGDISNTGWRSYFPIAFLIKTPIATMILILLGAVASIKYHDRRTKSPLAVGLVVFLVVYVMAMLTSRINIGHRHLTPIYPLLFILAGACARWATHRAGRVIIASMIVWLVGANAWIYPQYLSYFNELVGGPSQGYKYLADSNVDWGQDMLRLSDYMKAESLGADEVKLAWFGMVDPSVYGVDCEMLPSSAPFGKPASLVGGTYIVSVTQLLGVYAREVRDDYWQDSHNQEMFQQIGSLYESVLAGRELKVSPKQWQQLSQNWWYLRSCLLLNHLQKREPDGRIGYSMLIFHLTNDDVQRMTHL